MNLIFLRVLVDFGLVVLIWMVQLIIYPGFQFYEYDNLIQWHQNYTVAISLVVIPLMLSQLIISIIQLYKKRTRHTLLSFLLVVVLWGITFIVFVPLHTSIGLGDFTETTLTNLVYKNWYRTILWSVVFCLSLYQYYKSNISKHRIKIS